MVVVVDTLNCHPSPNLLSPLMLGTKTNIIFHAQSFLSESMRFQRNVKSICSSCWLPFSPNIFELSPFDKHCNLRQTSPVKYLQKLILKKKHSCRQISYIPLLA